MTTRRLLMRIVGAVALLSAVGGGLAYGAVPGAHRALTPGLFGMTRAGDAIYIDKTDDAAAVEALIAQAETVVAAFFGPLQARPVYVICTDTPCQDSFDLRPRGLTLGYHRILIAPHGLNARILTHERVHAELHRFMGLRDLFGQRFPAWFDEGLATLLSGDDRVIRPADPRRADWIRDARSFRDWGRLHANHDWRTTYGAAARLVEEIEERVGRDGLRRLIASVADGEDFDAALAGMMDGPAGARP